MRSPPPPHYRKYQGAHQPEFRGQLCQLVCPVPSDYWFLLSKPQFPALENGSDHLSPSEEYLK